MENAPTTLLFFTSSFRMVQFYNHRSRYVNLVKTSDGFVKDMLNSNDTIVSSLLNTSSRYMKNLTCLFWMSALITGNMMCISTLVFVFFTEPAENKLILHSWFPFNNSHYWLAYGLQYYIMNVGMLIVRIPFEIRIFMFQKFQMKKTLNILFYHKRFHVGTHSLYLLWLSSLQNLKF
jgi:hypothetical protein